MTTPAETLGAGARMFLSMVVSCIKRDRSDIRVRGWARKIADPHPTIAAKVAALVAAFEKTSELPEALPAVREMPARAAESLFEKRPVDADDVAVALGAACMSLGMNVKVVVQRVRHPKYADAKFLQMYLEVRDESGQWIDVNAYLHGDGALRACPEEGDGNAESETLLGRSAAAGHGCGDCAVEEGRVHELGCDMERCPFCGRQLMSCGCETKHFYPAHVNIHDVPPTPDTMLTPKERAHAKECHLSVCSLCDALQASGKTRGLPVRVYFDGLPKDQQAEWERVLEAKGRIPWICYPNICRRCGVLWPNMFHVSDEEWGRYVESAMRGFMLCEECYTWIKQQIEEASRERG